ncbi:MAG: hypothetical protein R3B13_20960 [Polyangiaceae bacterium]
MRVRVWSGWAPLAIAWAVVSVGCGEDSDSKSGSGGSSAGAAGAGASGTGGAGASGTGGAGASSTGGTGTGGAGASSTGGTGTGGAGASGTGGTGTGGTGASGTGGAGTGGAGTGGSGTGGGSAFAPNMPSGLSVVLDYSFTGTHSGGDVSSLDGTGLAITDWQTKPGDECHIVPDATSPAGATVWESVFDVGHSGTGPCAIDYSLKGARDTVYVAIWTKYSAGWQANGTSEKVIYWNTTAGPHKHLTEYTYGNESFEYLKSATGCQYLEANQASAPLSGNSPPCDTQRLTPITDGQWDMWEYQMTASSGTVKWWKNGALRALHTGRTFSPVTAFQLPDTWGGGGNLTQKQNRRYARILVATSAN